MKKCISLVLILAMVLSLALPFIGIACNNAAFTTHSVIAIIYIIFFYDCPVHLLC